MVLTQVPNAPILSAQSKPRVRGGLRKKLIWDCFMSDSPVPFLDLSLQIAPLRDEIIRGIADVCDAGHFVHGPPCQRLEASIANYCDVSHAIGCASGSDALLLALMALDVGPSATRSHPIVDLWRTDLLEL